MKSRRAGNDCSGKPREVEVKPRPTSGCLFPTKATAPQASHDSRSPVTQLTSTACRFGYASHLTIPSCRFLPVPFALILHIVLVAGLLPSFRRSIIHAIASVTSFQAPQRCDMPSSNELWTTPVRYVFRSCSSTLRRKSLQSTRRSDSTRPRCLSTASPSKRPRTALFFPGMSCHWPMPN